MGSLSIVRLSAGDRLSGKSVSQPFLPVFMWYFSFAQWVVAVKLVSGFPSKAISLNVAVHLVYPWKEERQESLMLPFWSTLQVFYIFSRYYEMACSVHVLTLLICWG